jgi:hypothetical protein
MVSVTSTPLSLGSFSSQANTMVATVLVSMLDYYYGRDCEATRKV